MTASVGWLLPNRAGSSILPRGKRIVIAGPNVIIYPTILSIYIATSWHLIKGLMNLSKLLRVRIAGGTPQATQYHSTTGARQVIK